MPKIRHSAGPAASMRQHYRPLERPRRYPLELTANLQICLWAEDGSYKWLIAQFVDPVDDGYTLQFVGARPLSDRVNWQHFRELVVAGQKLADVRAEFPQLPLYTVGKCDSHSRLLGPVHWAVDCKGFTVCGLPVLADGSWTVITNMHDGVATCRKCLRLFREIE